MDGSLRKNPAEHIPREELVQTFKNELKKLSEQRQKKMGLDLMPMASAGNKLNAKGDSKSYDSDPASPSPRRLTAAEATMNGSRQLLATTGQSQVWATSSGSVLKPVMKASDHVARAASSVAVAESGTTSKHTKRGAIKKRAILANPSSMPAPLIPRPLPKPTVAVTAAAAVDDDADGKEGAIAKPRKPLPRKSGASSRKLAERPKTPRPLPKPTATGKEGAKPKSRKPCPSMPAPLTPRQLLEPADKPVFPRPLPKLPRKAAVQPVIPRPLPQRMAPATTTTTTTTSSEEEEQESYWKPIPKPGVPRPLPNGAAAAPRSPVEPPVEQPIKSRFARRQERLQKLAEERKNHPVTPDIIPPINTPTYFNAGDEKPKLDAGTVYFGRYEVKRKLGQGAYGVVLKVWDRKTKTDKALKIIAMEKRESRNESLRDEIKMLGWIKQNMPKHNVHTVMMDSAFEYKNSYCITLPLYALDLRSRIDRSKARKLSLDLVQKITGQLLEALDFLGGPKVGLVHCDLKPDNIMLTDIRTVDVKVIDFGLARGRDECERGDNMQTRWYRAPEIAFGGDFNEAIDMWSLGTIVYEMFTGNILFPAAKSPQLVKMYRELLGEVPNSLLDNGKKTGEYFYHAPDGTYVLFKGILEKSPPKPLSKPLKSRIRYADVIENESGRFPDKEDFANFCDLVERILKYRPDRRISVKDALAHAFITTDMDKPKPRPLPVPPTKAVITTDMDKPKPRPLPVQPTNAPAKSITQKATGNATADMDKPKPRPLPIPPTMAPAKSITQKATGNATTDMDKPKPRPLPVPPTMAPAKSITQKATGKKPKDAKHVAPEKRNHPKKRKSRMNPVAPVKAPSTTESEDGESTPTESSTETTESKPEISPVPKVNLILVREANEPKDSKQELEEKKEEPTTDKPKQQATEVKDKEDNVNKSPLVEQTSPEPGNRDKKKRRGICQRFRRMMASAFCMSVDVANDNHKKDERKNKGAKKEVRKHGAKVECAKDNAPKKETKKKRRLPRIEIVWKIKCMQKYNRPQERDATNRTTEVPVTSANTDQVTDDDESEKTNTRNTADTTSPTTSESPDERVSRPILLVKEKTDNNDNNKDGKKPVSVSEAPQAEPKKQSTGVRNITVKPPAPLLPLRQQMQAIVNPKPPVITYQYPPNKDAYKGKCITYVNLSEPAFSNSYKLRVSREAIRLFEKNRAIPESVVMAHLRAFDYDNNGRKKLDD